ncbi:MAG: macro domain-containing protein, partial [Myxococcota bacterium]
INELEPFEEVRPRQGDIFDSPADALVSPANSFAIMDGGIDRAIWERLGFAVEKRAQDAILEHHHGELPVGHALIVPTEHAEWRWLIVAPTMRVPENVATTLNAYLAFRAALAAVVRFNRTNAEPIESVACPGMGTGIGGMSERRAAAQMRVAYQSLKAPARIASFNTIHEVHRKLKTVS